MTLEAAGDQTADFYAGIFKIRQGKAAKPRTTLTLTEKLSCPKAGKRDRGGQEEEAPPVGRRQRQVPHEGQAQRGDGRRAPSGWSRTAASRRSRAWSAGVSRCATSRRRRRSSSAPASGTSLARVDTTTPPTGPSRVLTARGASRLVAVAVTACLVVLAAPAVASAEVYVVNDTADPIPDNGLCAQGTCTLREAVDQARASRLDHRSRGNVRASRSASCRSTGDTINGAGARSTIIDGDSNRPRDVGRPTRAELPRRSAA